MGFHGPFDQTAVAGTVKFLLDELGRSQCGRVQWHLCEECHLPSTLGGSPTPQGGWWPALEVITQPAFLSKGRGSW